MGGLAGLVRSIAIGSVPLVITSCAAVFGAGLAPAVADWCSVTAAVEAIHRQNQTPSREEALAQIKAYRARLDSEPDTGDRRFRSWCQASLRLAGIGCIEGRRSLCRSRRPDPGRPSSIERLRRTVR